MECFKTWRWRFSVGIPAQSPYCFINALNRDRENSRKRLDVTRVATHSWLFTGINVATCHLNHSLAKINHSLARG